jgi:hypothetical protein
VSIHAQDSSKVGTGTLLMRDPEVTTNVSVRVDAPGFTSQEIRFGPEAEPIILLHPSFLMSI